MPSGRLAENAINQEIILWYSLYVLRRPPLMVGGVPLRVSIYSMPPLNYLWAEYNR